MIIKMHAIVYADDADRAREFLRDILGLRNVDAGDGWLIFRLPPAEVGVYAVGAPEAGRHELYLMCDDVAATVEELAAKGAEFVANISRIRAVNSCVPLNAVVDKQFIPMLRKPARASSPRSASTRQPAPLPAGPVAVSVTVSERPRAPGCAPNVPRNSARHSPHVPPSPFGPRCRNGAMSLMAAPGVALRCTRAGRPDAERVGGDVAGRAVAGIAGQDASGRIVHGLATGFTVGHPRARIAGEHPGGGVVEAV